MNQFAVLAVRKYVEGYGLLSEYEAQREACRLWDSLSFSAKRAVEASGVDGQIATTSGADGLRALRDALANVAVAA